MSKMIFFKSWDSRRCFTISSTIRVQYPFFYDDATRFNAIGVSTALNTPSRHVSIVKEQRARVVSTAYHRGPRPKSLASYLGLFSLPRHTTEISCKTKITRRITPARMVDGGSVVIGAVWLP